MFYFCKHAVRRCTGDGGWAVCGAVGGEEGLCCVTMRRVVGLPLHWFEICTVTRSAQGPEERSRLLAPTARPAAAAGGERAHSPRRLRLHPAPRPCLCRCRTCRAAPPSSTPPLSPPTRAARACLSTGGRAGRFQGQRRAAATGAPVPRHWEGTRCVASAMNLLHPCPLCLLCCAVPRPLQRHQGRHRGVHPLPSAAASAQGGQRGGVRVESMLRVPRCMHNNPLLTACRAPDAHPPAGHPRERRGCRPREWQLHARAGSAPAACRCLTACLRTSPSHPRPGPCPHLLPCPRRSGHP